MEKRNVDPALVSFGTNLIYAILIVFIAIAAIDKIGVKTTSLVAILGAAGLAVGFALQGALSNFASGVLIILFRPFRIGDFIDAGGAVGVVEDISILVTILKTPDNKKIIAPNSAIMGGIITNVTANETRRVDMVFGVSYTDDLEKVKSVLDDIIASDERILKDPAPQVVVAEHGDSSVNFKVRPWVKTGNYWDVYFDMHMKVKIRFDQEGISIPFPQRDVHLIQESTG
jgi:small conductance mechanosensitive channel